MLSKQLLNSSWATVAIAALVAVLAAEIGVSDSGNQPAHANDPTAAEVDSLCQP